MIETKTMYSCLRPILLLAVGLYTSISQAQTIEEIQTIESPHAMHFFQMEEALLGESGSSYFMGYASSPIDADPSPINEHYIGGSSPYMFIIKLDDQGEFAWAQALEVVTTYLFLSDHIALDKDENLYLSIAGIMPDLDPNPNKIYPKNYNHTCVAKYDAINGYLLWCNPIKNLYTIPKLKYGQKTEQLYVSGSFMDSIDFYSDTNFAYRLQALGQSDGLWASYSSDGVFQWAKSTAGSKNEYILPPCTISDGNVVAGVFQISANVSLDSTPHYIGSSTTALNNDGYIAKYSKDRRTEWAYVLGGRGDDYILDIKCNKHADILLQGRFEGTVDFDLKNRTGPSLSDSFNARFFLAFYDSVMNIKWAKNWKSRDLHVESIAFDASDHILISGSFFDYLYLDSTHRYAVSSAVPNVWGFRTILDPWDGSVLDFSISGESRNSNVLLFKQYHNAYIIAGYTALLKYFDHSGAKVLDYSPHNFLYRCAASKLPNSTRTPQQNSFFIYPHPVDEILHISSSDRRGALPDFISVVSVDGKRIFRKPFRQSIPLDGLAPGTYIAIIEVGKQKYFQRFLKK